MDAGKDAVDPREREQKQRNDEKPGALHDADVQLAVVGKGPGAEAHAASLEPAVHDGGEDRPAETERLTSVQRDGKGRGPGQKQLPDPCGDVGQLAQPQPVQKLLDRRIKGRVADGRVVAAAVAFAPAVVVCGRAYHRGKSRARLAKRRRRPNRSDRVGRSRRHGARQRIRAWTSRSQPHPQCCGSAAKREDAGNPHRNPLCSDAERFRELLWEGHRRTDLIRFDRFTSSSFLWTYKGGDNYNGQGFSDHMKIFAIPSTELASNPELHQNPGYGTSAAAE